MRLLKAKDVAERTSVSTAQIYRLVKNGRFPQPIRISEHRRGWLEDEVDQWIADCIKQNRTLA